MLKAEKTDSNPEAPQPPDGAQSIKDALIEALESLQQHEELKMSEWAKKNTTEFYKMALRLISTTDSSVNNALPPITEIEIFHTYEDKR